MTRRDAVTMPSPSRLRLFAHQVVTVVFAALCAVTAALAQSADSDATDPPGRVGSVSLLAGPVTMVDLATGSREEALLNWPVTGGWRIDTGRAGRAEVRIGSTALRLDEETTVDFARLDDQFVQIAVLRGSVALRLRNREIVNELEVLTQRERISFDEIGRYRIDVDRPPGVTALSAFAGRARVASGGSSFMVADGQRGELSAPPLIRFQLVAATVDRFDDWVAARDAREETIRSEAYVSRETTGIETLDQYGDWRTVEDYGPVWFPRDVSATWAPYRYGRWTSVSPWGWTWIDEAPWGFAPLHYGRWAVIGGGWGWIPGVVVPRPIYAPALVAWFGVPGVGIGVGAPIGWFPLGPREVYVPAYRHTPRYLRVVNVQHVTNVNQITIVQAPKYVNHHPDRSTWVPDNRFGRPEPVHRGQRPPPSEWRQYIARPQPPANVPNTKRRQSTEGATLAPSPTLPTTPTEARPIVRPPSVAPRAAEPSRPIEAPRAIETQRAQPAPPTAVPPPTVAPRSFEPPRTPEAPRARPAPTPATRPEPSRGPSEPAPAVRDERRTAPRAPAPSTQPPAPHQAPADRTRSREVTPAPTQPQTGETHAPRGRGEAPGPRDGQRQAPRAPSAPAMPAPAAAPPQAAPPPAAPPGARDSTRAPPARQAPPARTDGGSERGADRPGRPPNEAAR